MMAGILRISAARAIFTETKNKGGLSSTLEK
jgi:hypothetical protein